jgi:hypothetical protein
MAADASHANGASAEVERASCRWCARPLPNGDTAFTANGCCSSSCLEAWRLTIGRLRRRRVDVTRLERHWTRALAAAVSGSDAAHDAAAHVERYERELVHLDQRLTERAATGREAPADLPVSLSGPEAEYRDDCAVGDRSESR